jgi:hypothetical protein
MIGCKWNWHNTGQQVWYDKSTFETLKTTFPLYFYDDFLGAAGGSVFDATQKWQVVDVGALATAAIVANSSNGQFLLHIATTDEAEDAVLYHNDQLMFDVGNGLIFETKVNMAVAPGTGVEGVLGMAGPHNLDKDTVANAAWFKFDASMVCVAESDDTTNNNDDVATGVTVVAGTYNIFRIDFTTITDVKFFIDGVRVSTGTTFDMSNLSAAEQQMQPYFSMDKAGGLAALGDMNIDYVKIWSNR